MSNKKEILVVGVLSAVLFTGFTVYNHANGNRHETGRPLKKLETQAELTQSPKNQVKLAASESTEQTPPDQPGRKQNTKTKAS